MIYQPIEYTGEYTTGTIYSEEYVKKLEQQLQQKENIIKEVREYIEKMTYDNPDTDFELEVNKILGNALEILDKGE